MAVAKKKHWAPRSCRECQKWPSVRNRVRVGESLAKVIKKMEGEIAKKDFKTTMADYLKLMQLEKEFESSETKEIRVKWVEPAEKADTVKSK